jgi:hypothetical protein
VAALATLRTELSRGERAFTGWMAPRGIVAAATATTFSAHGVGGAAKILPVTFLVIAVTVTVYGLSAAPVARAVGVLNQPSARTLLVGGAHTSIRATGGGSGSISMESRPEHRTKQRKVGVSHSRDIRHPPGGDRWRWVRRLVLGAGAEPRAGPGDPARPR